MGSVLLITFEVFVLHIVPDPLCTSIGSIVFKCEGKDTNLFSNIQIFNVKKDQKDRPRDLHYISINRSIEIPMAKNKKDMICHRI